MGKKKQEKYKHDHEHEHKYHKIATELNAFNAHNHINNDYYDDVSAVINHSSFGSKRRTSKKKANKNIRIKRSKRTSRTSKKRSFGSILNNEHFRLFLISTVIIIIRSLAKKSSNSISSDILNIEYAAVNILTVSSLLELIGYLVGKEIRDKIVLGYIVLSIGLDMSKLI